MDSYDRRLGMGKAISRRDFLNGLGVTIGSSLLPGCDVIGEHPANQISAAYPPGYTGLRGSHPGSFETAHALLRGHKWQAVNTGEHYDLVIVGAGISGLAAAYFYQRDVNPRARILILDSHDDFGGHAKRNEFTVDGRKLVGFGGTMLMESPKSYPEVAKQLMDELGIDTHRFGEFHDVRLYKNHKLESGTFFDSDTYGADFLATGGDGYIESIGQAPLSERGKAELERLFADEEDYLAGKTAAERREIVESTSWREYLQRYADMSDETLAFVQKWPHGVWAIGADAFPAWMAWIEGYPGFAGMDLGYELDEEEEDWDFFHFPDGNATIARLLVGKLIGSITIARSAEDIVDARFNYAELDREENNNRIRLNATVVELRHRDDSLNTPVEVSYVQNNTAKIVTGDRVIWAGYNQMLPHVCEDVPVSQAAALASSLRAPLVYTSVAVRNWQSLVELGLRRAYCPGSFYHMMMVTWPVSIGGYKFARSPDEPVILHLTHIPLAPGMSAVEQFREGKKMLLQTPFETFEHHVRDQLGRMLGPGGFDPARDIAGITVNRWPHGYAYSMDAASGDIAWWPEIWRHERKPWIDARQRIGNIAIAGSDSASNAMTEAAIEQAHRAVASFALERGAAVAS